MQTDPHPELTAAMLALFQQANAIVSLQDNFVDRLTRYHGFATATHYIQMPLATSGLTKLWENKRLELSVEAQVLRPEWHSLFDLANLQRAYKRLSEFTFNFPVGYWSPGTNLSIAASWNQESSPIYVDGKTYTRNDIYEILALSNEQRGGDYNGYHRNLSDFYVFCNVGVASRTGHDDDHWAGGRRVWFGKTSSHFGQSTIQHLLSGEHRILIRYPEAACDPFTFAGVGTPIPHRTIERPVRINWVFGSDNSKQTPLFTDEFSVGSMYVEGERVQVYVKRYEHDRRARNKCIRIHGVNCAVCEINFKATYGDMEEGSIVRNAKASVPTG